MTGRTRARVPLRGQAFASPPAALRSGTPVTSTTSPNPQDWRYVGEPGEPPFERGWRNMSKAGHLHPSLKPPLHPRHLPSARGNRDQP